MNACTSKNLTHWGTRATTAGGIAGAISTPVGVVSGIGGYYLNEINHCADTTGKTYVKFHPLNPLWSYSVSCN